MENKVLTIYSTGNYIYPMMNHNGKGFFFLRNVYVKVNHFAVQQKITQHEVNYNF